MCAGGVWACLDGVDGAEGAPEGAVVGTGEGTLVGAAVGSRVNVPLVRASIAPPDPGSIKAFTRDASSTYLVGLEVVCFVGNFDGASVGGDGALAG